MEKVKRIPVDSGRRLAAREAATSWVLFFRGGRGGGRAPFELVGASPKLRPVTKTQIRRTVRERQRSVRVTRAGRECQLKTTVPTARTTRFVVRMYSGGRLRAIQSGRTNSIRMKRTVSAGRVVAEVAVRWVERKSVNRKNGSRSILQREVKSFRSSTISSRLLWCLILLSDSARLCPFCPFSPVHPVEDNGEYLRAYMPRIKLDTTMIGPAYLVTASPYMTTAQKLATSRKLSHGSWVVHVNSPANLFSGRRKGCEYARTRVTCGGVAARSGDFWCTSMAERSFVCGVTWPMLAGEKVA